MRRAVPMIPRRVAVRLCLGILCLAWMPRSADAGAESEPDVVDLSPNLEVGLQWRYRCRVTSKMKISMPGEDHEVSMAKEANIRLEVVAVDDGIALVELQHEDIRLNVDGPHPGSFDTFKRGPFGEDNLYARLLRPLLTARLTLEIDETGVVRRVRGLHDLLPDDELEARLFEGLFGEDEIIRMFGPIFCLKPGSPEARVGQSWDVTLRRAKGLGVVQSTHALSLKRAGPRDAFIDIGGQESVETPAESSPTIGESRIRGSAIWDRRQGVLRSMTTESLTRFGPDPRNTEGIEIRGQVTAKTALRRLDSSSG